MAKTETPQMPAGPVKKTVMTSIALRAAAHAKTHLEQILAEVRYTRQFVTGRKHYSLPMTGQMGSSKEVQFNGIERIPAGFTFIVRRLTAQAPAGCQLELYKNSVSSDNFWEVVANIQVYANSVPGQAIIEGPAEIVAVVTKATAEGSVSITLSGYLVPTHTVKYITKQEGHR